MAVLYVVVIFGWIWGPFLFGIAAGSPYPYSDCFDKFIPEGTSVTCHCKANETTTTSTLRTPISSSIYWLNSTGINRTVLELTGVTRDMNGSKYICVMQSESGIRNVTYELRVAYGPADADTTILAPSPFITDGTRDLNLTCNVTNTYPAPWITWTYVTCRGGRTEPCETRLRVPEDDNLRVLCTAYSTAHHVEVVSSTAVFTLKLSYPPKQPPRIRTQTNNKILKTGDTITCTVSGGSPPVKRVIFNCSNPTLYDVSYATDPDASSISRSVIVDTKEATADFMVCSCMGVWEPDPSLYGYSSSATFLLEYKATITNFTVNTSSELVVMEEDQSAVEFHCDVMGRASAEVTLHKQRSNDTLGKTVEVVGEESSRRKIHRYVLSPARCEDMGVFTCKADSGYLGPSTRSVRLTVNCGPRPYYPFLGAGASDRDDDVIIQLKGKEPAELTLVAYPVPEHVHFSFVHSADERYNDSTPALDDLFDVKCAGNELVQHLVKCRVGRGRIAGDHAGRYNVTVANAFGAFQFVLDVRPIKDDGILSAAATVLISATVAATVLIVVIVFIVFLLRKRRGRGRYYQTEASHRQGDVECTRVSHRRSLAAYMAEEDEDPSNSRVPFVEVVPISSDIQFKSTNPSDAPVSFSEILPSLSSDGQAISESLRARNEGLPVLTGLFQRASGSPLPSRVPRAQVSPFFSMFKKETGDGNKSDSDEKKSIESEEGDNEYPTMPAWSRTCQGYPGSVGDGTTLEGGRKEDADESNIVWMDSDAGQSESSLHLHSVSSDTPREAYSGVEDAAVGEADSSLKPPGPDSSLPLQSLVSSGSRSRTFITKIYLPNQSPGADSHGQEGSGDLSSAGNEYAVVNKKGKESQPPTRPLLKEVFAKHDDEGCAEGTKADPTNDATFTAVKSYTKPLSHRSTAYEDVVVAGEDNGTEASVRMRGPERPPRADRPKRASEEAAKSKRSMKERQESTQGVHSPAKTGVMETESTHDHEEDRREADNSGEQRTKEHTDTQTRVAQTPEQVHSLKSEELLQEPHSPDQARPLTRKDLQESQTPEQAHPLPREEIQESLRQDRQPHRFLKKHEDETTQRQPKAEIRKPENKQGTASLTRHRRKKTEAEDEVTPQDSQDEAAAAAHSHSMKSMATDPTADAPKPKKRTRKLTKRRRKSDLDSEADEAHILGP